MRRKAGYFRVTDGNSLLVVKAKTAGGAVSKFAKRFRKRLTTDHETGGWKGISVSFDGYK